MDRGFRALFMIVVFVMVGFILGGWVGREVGKRSPSFVAALAPPGPHHSPANILNAAEFGEGLGMVFGLFFGAGTGLFVILLIGVCDIWMERRKPSAP
ncbi:MAG: hypothetical protein NVSMB14_03960 [Isosphaeraceae bacterium]